MVWKLGKRNLKSQTGTDNSAIQFSLSLRMALCEQIAEIVFGELGTNSGGLHYSFFNQGLRLILPNLWNPYSVSGVEWCRHEKPQPQYEHEALAS